MKIGVWNVKRCKTLNNGFIYLGSTGSASVKQINTNEISNSAVTSVKIDNNIFLAGIPTVDTASSETNTTQIASTAFVKTAISNLVSSAPATLDTLNELAQALGNDANFSTTVTNLISERVSKIGDETISGVKTFSTGSGTFTMATSVNGIQWTGIAGSASVFTTSAYNIAWNGSIYVAVGSGTNSIAWSTDLVVWTGLGTGIFSTGGYGVTWNGRKFIAVGSGTNTMAYSNDGKVWIGVPNNSNYFTTSAYGVWSNSLANPMSVSINNQIVLNKYQGVYSNSVNQLDVVSESYYNNGYANMTFTAGSINLA